MKLCDPLFICRPVTAAPALNRGLAVLAALGLQSPRSLDQLTTLLDLPKASVFRLLETLEKVELVRKRTDKRYEALWALRPLEDAWTLRRKRLQAEITALCQTTGCTVEWYEPTQAGMKLVLQGNPETELCVKAKPGFLRDWTTEFEAVTRLGHAFCAHAPKLRSIPIYVANGKTRPLPAPRIQKLIQECKAEAATYDLMFNTNGVRRHAAAAFDDDTKTFLGVLAIAEGYHFTRRPRTQTYLKMLKSTLA